jgi:superfamily II DNA/RNA helicase
VQENAAEGIATQEVEPNHENDPSKPLLVERQAREWTSERVRKIMQESSRRWMNVRLNISAWRHSAIAISRRFCHEDRFHEQKRKLDEDEEWDEDNVEGDDLWDLQAGHGTHVAGMIYAQELMEGDNSIVSRREKFQRVSHVWHCLLGFASAHQGVGIGIGAKQKRQAFEEEMQDAQLNRWKRLRGVDIHRELEQMLGEGAQFRSEQEPALQAIMKNKSPILVIMGTGAGKSLLFMLPAHRISTGTTVVVVPLVSLQGNLDQRCRAAGISCIKWNSRQPGRVAQIVLVTPESAVSKTFATFLDRLQGLHQLDRIVIDECHTILETSPKFRPKMREFGELSRRGVQMVFLTTTLRPVDEDRFCSITQVQIPPDCYFRGCTSRPNIEYSVVEYDPNVEQTEAVRALAARKLEEHPAPAKIIIYSSSITTTQELSIALECRAYYRDVGDVKEKDQIAQAFHRADGQVMVATNAFGLGIDEPDIRVVIHVGIIHQMASYVQESGRAGRDRKRSQAIIVMPAGQQEGLQKRHAKTWHQRKSMQRPVITEVN